MISQLAVLSVVSAAVQFDFKVSNSHDLKLSGKSHKTHKASHVANVSSTNSTNSTNSTVEPVINASLSSSYNFYYGELLVGVPPQKFEVLLDTGSPVSWLYGPNGSYDNATQYVPGRSATHKKVNQTFSAEYGSGEYLGYWASDLVAAPQFVASNVTRNVSVANTTNSTGNATYNYTVPVGNGTAFNLTAINTTLHSNSTFNKTNVSVVPYSVPFEFGVVTSYATAAGAPGLLGLGPHIEGAGPEGYLSLPEAYKKYNVTSSSAFSVFLEKDVGRFLFGGADLKYVQLPFYRYSPRKISNKTEPTAYTVTLDSLAVDGRRNFSINSTASLDSGSPISLLPPNFVEEVGRVLNFTRNEKYQAYYTNSSRIPKGTISFHLNGGLEVTADISSFLVPGRYIWLDDGPQNVTALSFLGSSSYLLGDAFFRSTYTVLDPANGDVLVAKRSQVTINSTNSTNASTVVPINQLLNNKTAVVDVAANITASNKTTSIAGAGGSKTLPFAANGYVGTVPASLTAEVAAASGSASSSSSASSSKSKKKKNAAISNSPSVLLSLAAAAFYLV